MQIENVSIDSIRPYEKNAKKHPPEQVERLARELKDVGFTQPIVIDNDGVIVAGHGRFESAKLAGFTEVPVHRLPADISPERIRAIRLFDNKIAESGMDEKLLRQELSELVAIDGFDFAWTGFAESEIVDVLPEDNDWVKEREQKKAEDDEKADAVPELTEQNPRGVVRGQVWKLGRHRLMCGDSTSADDVARLMDGNKAELVYTDPPYGIAYSSKKFDGNKSGVTNKRNNAEMIKGDATDFDPSFLLSIPSKETFVWGYQYYPHKLGRGGIIVWNKKKESEGDCPHGDFELCWSKKERNKMCWLRWGGFANKEKGEERLHTTQKPVALAEWFFENWASGLDVVLDLFGGSGSTLIACEKTGRTCFMMELDEHYCSIIIERWEQFTGQKAELLTSP